MQIKLVIFDFDGTLADTRSHIVRTLDMTLRAEFGNDAVIPDESAMVSTIGLPLRDAFMQLVPGLDGRCADSCVETYRMLFEKNQAEAAVELFPRVADTLRFLATRGVRLSIASSRGHESLEHLSASAGILPYFSYILGADDVRRAKPAPDPVLQTLAAFGIAPSEALVVGDMVYDIAMGKAAGARTCAVTYGNAARRELEASGAEWVVDDFAEIGAIVR